MKCKSIFQSMTIPEKNLISQRPISDFRNMKGSTNLEDQSLSVHFRRNDFTNVNTLNKLAGLWKLWGPGCNWQVFLVNLKKSMYIYINEYTYIYISNKGHKHLKLLKIHIEKTKQTSKSKGQTKNNHKLIPLLTGPSCNVRKSTSRHPCW